jgi:hypothetical protein
MILRQSEADVLELIRQGVQLKDIAANLGIPKVTASNAVARLSELSAIRRIEPGKYEVLVRRTNQPSENGIVYSGAISTRKIDIPADVEFYIRNHYGKVPRSRIARSLNLDKVTLNLMIIQMRLGS